MSKSKKTKRPPRKPIDEEKGQEALRVKADLMAEMANRLIDQRLLPGLVSRKRREGFVNLWCSIKVNGLDLSDKQVTQRALAQTRTAAGNPFMWWAIAFILEHFIVPWIIKIFSSEG